MIEDHQLKFKYNGKDLGLMKYWANTEDSHEAIESFIRTSLFYFKKPNEMLKELRDGRLDKGPVAKE